VVGACRIQAFHQRSSMLFLCKNAQVVFTYTEERVYSYCVDSVEIRAQQPLRAESRQRRGQKRGVRWLALVKQYLLHLRHPLHPFHIVSIDLSLILHCIERPVRLATATTLSLTF